MGGHNDWALDTVFSADGSHLISVGRDQAARLTEVATQRFVDNITSITPGAQGADRRRGAAPKANEIVVGGSDGEPKLYRVFRQTVRVIGDDSNLIREFPAMPGRIYGVAVSADGKRLAAGSSLDGAGQVVHGKSDKTGSTPLENPFTRASSWRRSTTPLASTRRRSSLTT